MAEVLAQNPFPDAPGNRVVAIFLDEVTSPAVLDDVVGRADDEELRLGRREIYVRYGAGMATSTLRIPAAKKGTARNMNTVAKRRECRSSPSDAVQNGGNRGQSNRRLALAFAHGCPRAFTGCENHLLTARTVRTKAPLRRVGVRHRKTGDFGVNEII